MSMPRHKFIDRRLAKKIMAYRKYSNAQSRRFFRRHPEFAQLNLAVAQFMPSVPRHDGKDGAA